MNAKHLLFPRLQGVRNDLVQEEEVYELGHMDVSLIGANRKAKIIKEEP